MILESVSTINFPQTIVAGNSTQPFTIFNTSAYIVHVTIVSSQPTVFIPSLSSITMPANSSTLVNVQFVPNIAGNITGTLTISNDDPIDLTPDVLSLAGIGVQPTISVTPVSLDFQAVSLLDSKSLAITVTNTSTSVPLTISSIVSTNARFSPNMSAFVLAPLASQTVNIAFVPLVVGSATGIISINNNSIIPIVSVSVLGTGAVASLITDVSSLSFGNVTINEPKTLNIIATNNSVDLVRVVISSVSTTNTKFQESVTAFVIEHNSSLQIPVRFVPTDLVPQAGFLNIVSNASPVSVSLSGQGIAAPDIKISTTSINYGNVGFASSLVK